MTEQEQPPPAEKRKRPSARVDVNACFEAGLLDVGDDILWVDQSGRARCFLKVTQYMNTDLAEPA